MTVNHSALLDEFVALAESKGYEIEQKTNNSVLMGNYGK